MLDMIEFETYDWNQKRMKSMVPAHYVASSGAVHMDSVAWIINALKGNFSIFVQDVKIKVAFEDPGEAMMFTLRWS